MEPGVLTGVSQRTLATNPARFDETSPASRLLPPYDTKDHSRCIMTEPTYEELKARLADLEKQVDTKKRSGAIEFRVSEKGGVSVYGLGRFPVTLYYEQWTKLLDAVPDLKAFIEENKSKLKLKQG